MRRNGRKVTKVVVSEYFSENKVSNCINYECFPKSQLLPKAPQAVQLRDVIAKTTCAVYALESMLYLTAGFADTYENADIDVESCILKVNGFI